MLKRFFRVETDLFTIGILFEVILFSIIYFGIGYFYNKTDPFLIKQEINFLLIFLLTLTLFYGLAIGLLIIFLFAVFMYYYYHPFPIYYFLENLVVVLIAGEFNFFYKKSFKRLKEENKYIESKINQLRNAFYSLKLSHDQLEKSYILKPVSLRAILYDIKNLTLQNEKEAAEEVMKIIVKLFDVKQALFLKDNQILAYIGEKFSINQDDEMIKTAIEEKRAVYIAENINKEELGEEYLAVIPALNMENEITGLFIIKEMPFLNFNKENIMVISIIISLFADFLTYKKSVEKYRDISLCEPEFMYEVDRLTKLQKDFGIETHLVIFKYYEKFNIDKEEFFEFIENNIRTVDMVCKQGDIAIVLLPFVPLSGAKAFQERMKERLYQEFGIEKELFYSRIFKLNDKNLETIFKNEL